jgi:hypothetical protein
VAGCGRVTVAVGSQLGSQLGYPAIPPTRRNSAALRRPPRDHRRCAGGRAEIAVEPPDGIPAAGSSALTGRELTSFALTEILVRRL